HYYRFCYTFFFFQAEDGIRDFHVTGVQTCALPIFAVTATCATGCRPQDQDADPGGEAGPAGEHDGEVHHDEGAPHDAGHDAHGRSEERRVGKEWSERG